MLNDSEYSIIKKLKSNFGETWEKFCLKLSELREAAIKEINCCNKNVKKKWKIQIIKLLFKYAFKKHKIFN